MKPNKVFNRFRESDTLEMRSSQVEGEDEQRFVNGVGIVYNQEVEIWPGYMEQIEAGAFTETLNSGAEIKSYFNHDASQVLSTTKSDPKLEIKDTSEGLEFSSPIPPTSYGEDLAVNLDRKNVRGASFSFTVDEDTLLEDENGVYHRTIKKATLFEVGPVTNPAYPQTEVGLRDKESILQEMKERCKKDAPKSNVSLYKAKLTLMEGALHD